jgi:hypothetical protein
MDSEFSPSANSNRDSCHLMTAYSTASLLFCQQQFGNSGGDSTPDCFGQADNSSVFLYDHLTTGNSSPGGDVEKKVIKTEDEQPVQKVSFVTNVGSSLVWTFKLDTM